jgi:hypothetical protein
MSSSSGLFLTIKPYVKYGGLLLPIIKGGSLDALLLEKNLRQGKLCALRINSTINSKISWFQNGL